jgi:hypothetical protein
MGLFPSGFPTLTLYTPLLSPSALHALPISFFSILSPAQYWVRSTDHELTVHNIRVFALLKCDWQLIKCYDVTERSMMQGYESSSV